MSWRVHQAEALNGISPASFSAYARLNGWELVEPYGRHADVYAAPSLPEVILPRTRRLADYAEVASRLVQIFAQEAGVDEQELLRELTIADSDAVRVRASSDQTVAVADGLALIAGAKDMIAAAVRSLFEPRAVYRGRPAQEVSNYMRGVRLTGLEQGSFVVTLLPPAVPPAVGGQGTPRHRKAGRQPGEEPIERQATERLADALEATGQAVAAAIGGEGDAFGNAVSRGASANLCDALAEMTAPFEALDLSVIWALTRPREVSGAASRFEFAQQDAPVLREGARTLRERRVQEDVQLTATVEGLNRSGRELTLRTQVDGAMRSVVAQVTEADYERAIDIHKGKAKVELRGDLELSRGRCSLLNPHIVA